MAAPATVTMENISGKYVLNSKLTDNDATQKILAEQGVGFVTRKIIKAATITINVNHYDKEGTEQIDITSTLTGGISASPEYRTLNGTALTEPQENSLFGFVGGKSMRMTKEQLQAAHGDKPFLLEGWSDECFDNGKGGIIVSESWSWTEKTKKVWGVVQTWGFQDINGERRYTRKVYLMTKNGEIGKGDVTAIMVYDYSGAAA